MSNPIVDEIHRIRQEMLAEAGGDLKKLVENSKCKVDELRRRGWQFKEYKPTAKRKSPKKPASKTRRAKPKKVLA